MQYFLFRGGTQKNISWSRSQFWDYFDTAGSGSASDEARFRNYAVSKILMTRALFSVYLSGMCCFLAGISKKVSTCRRERSNISPETALMTDSCFVAKFRFCWGFWFSLLSYFLLSIDVLKYAKLLLYLQQGLTATDLQVMNGSCIFIFISLPWWCLDFARYG